MPENGARTAVGGPGAGVEGQDTGARLIEALRAEAARAWSVAGGGRCQCGEVVTLTADGRLTEHYATPTFAESLDEIPESEREVCEWSGTREHEPPNLTFRHEPDCCRLPQALRGKRLAEQRIARVLNYLDELAAVEDAPYPLTVTHEAVRRILTEEAPDA